MYERVTYSRNDGTEIVKGDVETLLEDWNAGLVGAQTEVKIEGLHIPRSALEVLDAYSTTQAELELGATWAYADLCMRNGRLAAFLFMTAGVFAASYPHWTVALFLVAGLIYISTRNLERRWSVAFPAMKKRIFDPDKNGD